MLYALLLVLRTNQLGHTAESLLDDIMTAWYDAKKFESEILCRYWPPFSVASQNLAAPCATNGIAFI